MKGVSILTLIMALFSCGDEVEPDERVPDGQVSATVELFFTGGLEVDGCEFFVDYEDTIYKPVNEEVIPDTFMEDTIKVEMVFEILGDPIDYQCGLNPIPTRYNALRILSID